MLQHTSDHTVQLSRCFERSRNAQKFLIPSKNVLRLTCASLASDSRVTRKFYVIQFASDAQSSFGSSRIAHGSLRDARRDSSHYNIQVYVLIESICKLLLFRLVSTLFIINDAQFNYNYMYFRLLINCFVLYVWDYFGQSFMFGAILDIKNNK